ncbi:MAG: hypothetical protein IPM32_06180 [Ignavibacteriae bacterium]|nr:hypothetical protein [Ignavibacteriota bacterium]
MNTGQTLITIAALALIVLTVLNFNKSSLNTQDNLIYNKEYIVTTTAAQSLLEEISSKAFDEKIVNGATITNASNFTSSLVAETGETYPNFDDIDDYNNFNRKDSISNLGVFNFMAKVNYVNDDLQFSGANTYHKAVKIKVVNPNLKNPFTGIVDTITITTVFSQWKML